MKFVKWYIRIPCRTAGFLRPAAPGQYLTGISKVDGFLVPAWGAEAPVSYPGASARFLVRELRRVGYNVSRRPWFVYARRQRHLMRKQDPWK